MRIKLGKAFKIYCNSKELLEMTDDKIDVKWIIVTFLILYSMTLMASMLLLFSLSSLRIVLPCIPPELDLSNWLQFIYFSLIFSLGFSLTTIFLYIVKFRRKTVDYYIKEENHKH